MDKQEEGWRKASYSNGSGNCVEVAAPPSRVLVRDTKDRQGAELSFRGETWREFIASLKGDAS